MAVLDVDMPHKDGCAVAREVKELRLTVALIFLTMHKNERFFNAALDLGVKGYVLKDSAGSEIVSAIRAVAAGQHYVTPLLTDYLLNRRRAGLQAEQQTGLGALTEAERRVLRLVATTRRAKRSPTSCLSVSALSNVTAPTSPSSSISRARTLCCNSPPNINRGCHDK